MTTKFIEYWWDYFLTYETSLLLFFQDKLRPFEGNLVLLSEWGPYGATYYLIPLLGAFHGEIMTESYILLASVNILTDILKLIFQSSRPFWWINETTIYNRITRPKLRQHFLTCETSSGFPSGHSSVFTAILLYERKHIKSIIHKMTNLNSKIINFIVDTLIVFCLCSLWLTRIYFACHFLYQCIMGSLLAVITLNYVERYKHKILNATKKSAVTFVCIIGLIAGLIYLLMKYVFDLDPQYSIRMGFKWCEDPTYLSPETTVMASLFRNIGTALGVALALPFNRVKNEKLNIWKSIPATIILIIGRNYLGQNTPKYKGRFVFLAWKGVVNTIFTFLMTWGVTKFIYHNNQKKKN